MHLGRLVIIFLREELRLRGRVTPAFSLFFFPQIVLVGSLAGYLLHPLVLDEVGIGTIHFSLVAGLFMFGMTMGGLAFLGKDLMERAIGPVTMLSAAVRFQPLSDRRMFLGYFLHDLVFFAGLVLLPMGAGMAVGCLVMPMGIGRLLFLNACYWTAFVQGMALSLCMSACIVNGRRWMLLLLPLFFVPLFAAQLHSGDPRGFSTTYTAIGKGSVPWLAISAALSVVYAAAGVLLYEGSARSVRSGAPWSYRGVGRFARLARSGRSSVMGREVLNLARGRAYIGIAFSLFVPILVLAAFSGILSSVGGIPQGFNAVFFSVMVSIFTVSIYNGLVNLDSLDFDQTLPLDVPAIVRAKVRLHLVLALPTWAVITVIIGAFSGDGIGLAVGMPVGLVTVVYMGYATAYLTGLWTNSMLFDASVFLRYVAFSALPMLYATILSFTMDEWPLPSMGALAVYIALAILSTAIMDRGIDRRWKDRVLASAGSV